jgi:phospholipase A1
MTNALGAFAAVALVGATLSPAASAADDELARCAKLEDTAARLACYDELARRPSAAEALPEPQSDSAFLTRAWKLGPEDGGVRPLGNILSYRPNYVDARWTDGPNVRPRSPSTGRAVPEDLNRWEAKLQASFKTELISRQAFERARITPVLGNFGVESVRLWFGYTQSMQWQAFNHGQSRPMRDTNFEPEAILTLGTGSEDGLKLINLGLSHQSNGIDPREHRGWSRWYVQGGWEWGRFSVLARLWHILPQSDDDNPNIDSFYGHGDIVARYQSARGIVTSVLLRGNDATGLGFLQVDMASPSLRALGGLKFHLQFTSGYGETLIDYNFRQRTVGIGVSFGDW